MATATSVFAMRLPARNPIACCDSGRRALTGRVSASVKRCIVNRAIRRNDSVARVSSATRPTCRRPIISVPLAVNTESEVEEEEGEAQLGIQPGEGGDWQWERSGDCGRAYAAWASLLLLGSLPFMPDVGGFDQIYFLLLATFTIYIGAHRNLTAKTRQSLTVKEGALAPLVASATLFGGYLVFKFFPDLNIQTALNAYFALIGTTAVAGNLLWPLRQWTGKAALGAESVKLGVPEGWLLETDGSSITEATPSFPLPHP